MTLNKLINKLKYSTHTQQMGQTQEDITLNIQTCDKTNTRILCPHKIAKLQTIQNTTVHIVTGCTFNTQKK